MMKSSLLSDFMTPSIYHSEAFFINLTNNLEPAFWLDLMRPDELLQDQLPALQHVQVHRLLEPLISKETFVLITSKHAFHEIS